MKQLLKLNLFLLVFAFVACQSSTEQNDKTGKEYTSAYICPMHCEGSGSDKPGICPACGMDYEKNEKTISKDSLEIET